MRLFYAETASDLETCNLDVTAQPTKLKARVLQSPEIRFGKTEISPRNGSFGLRNGELLGFLDSNIQLRV